MAKKVNEKTLSQHVMDAGKYSAPASALAGLCTLLFTLFIRELDAVQMVTMQGGLTVLWDIVLYVLKQKLGISYLDK